MPSKISGKGTKKKTEASDDSSSEYSSDEDEPAKKAAPAKVSGKDKNKKTRPVYDSSLTEFLYCVLRECTFLSQCPCQPSLYL